MESQNKLKYPAAIVTLFLLGWVVGFFADPYLPSPVSNREQGFHAGFLAAKSLVENSPLGSTMLRTPDDIRTLSGTVTALSGNSVTLHTISSDPFADEALSERTVLIVDTTKILVLTQKDQKTLQSEIAAFAKAPQVSAIPPTPFIQTAATLSSIKVGSMLSVTASENITSMKEFTASRIQIQESVNN